LKQPTWIEDLKEKRQTYGLSQNKLAIASGITRQYLSDIETGKVIPTIPVSAGEKNFDYNAEVELINPVADTVASATYMGADVDWYIKADDIVLKKPAHNQPSELKPNPNKK